MILKLLPDQVTALWEVFKFGLVKANKVREDEKEAFLRNVLTQLLAGTAQCWVLFEYNEQGTKDFYAFAITCVIHDPVFAVDYLLIHTLYALRPMPFEIMTEGIGAVKEFAQINGLHRVVAFTYDERITKLFERYGMKQELMVYSMEV